MVQFGLVLLTAVGAGFYLLSHVYFFNPLTFRRDDVTYLPWSYYKNPLQVEYFVNGNGSGRSKVIKEKAEIELVFAELKKGLQNTRPTTALDHGVEGKIIWLVIRHIPTEGVLLSAIGYEGSDIMVLGGMKDVPVRLTENLRSLIRRRLEMAE